jgi:hypothetical protein
MIRSAEEFVALRTSENPVEYQRAAWESASLETWRQVIEQFPEMAEWVAHNKTIPPEVMKRLFDLGDEKVRFVLAMKRSATPELLAKLSIDTCESVRLAVAMNPKTPNELLEILETDEWQEVRDAVARRRSN